MAKHINSSKVRRLQFHIVPHIIAAAVESTSSSQFMCSYSVPC